MEIRSFSDQEALRDLQALVFSMMDAEDHRDFSERLMAAQSGGRNAAAEIQDAVIASDRFKDLVRHDGWVSMAADSLNIDPDQVKIVFPHFRVHLPDTFKEDKTKMLLPWHQELDYWLPKGDCSIESIVLSTYLHDTAPENGALVLSAEAETEPMPHASRYMDEENKRFFRVECPEPEKIIYGETCFGDTVVFDFLRRHRSGYNSSNLVRLTFLLRASDRRLI